PTRGVDFYEPVQNTSRRGCPVREVRHDEHCVAVGETADALGPWQSVLPNRFTIAVKFQGLPRLGIRHQVVSTSYSLERANVRGTPIEPSFSSSDFSRGRFELE